MENEGGTGSEEVRSRCVGTDLTSVAYRKAAATGEYPVIEIESIQSMISFRGRPCSAVRRPLKAINHSNHLRLAYIGRPLTYANRELLRAMTIPVSSGCLIPVIPVGTPHIYQSPE